MAWSLTLRRCILGCRVFNKSSRRGHKCLLQDTVASHFPLLPISALKQLYHKQERVVKYLKWLYDTGLQYLFAACQHLLTVEHVWLELQKAPEK